MNKTETKAYKHMRYTGDACGYFAKITFVPVRETTNPYSPLQYFSGCFWQNARPNQLHETKELASAQYAKDKKKKIESLARDIARLATAEPKWKQP